MPRRAACSSKAGISINRPIIWVITARHRLMSTPFFSAIFTPSAAAFATAQICGSVKQVVTLVGMPREVSDLDHLDAFGAGRHLDHHVGRNRPDLLGIAIMRSVSVIRRGSSWPEM